MGEQVPSRGEVGQAAVWLGKHGVRVRIPTRLPATRPGVRVSPWRRSLIVRALDRPRPSWRELVNGWYFASAVVTFAGGAALGATMFFAPGYRTYAWSWLGLLGLSAVVFAAIFTDLITTHRQPPGFALWLIGYVVLAIALQIVGTVIHWRRRAALPDGHYGELLPAQERVR